MSRLQKKLKNSGNNFVNQKINRKAEVLREELDEEILLFNPKTRNTYVLNPMADVIWELCDGEHTPSDISAEISGVLNTDTGEVLTDVFKTVEDFLNHNLVHIK